MRDALMEGLAGLGQSGMEFAKTKSALKESAARLKESEQSQTLNTQKINANTETMAQALARKQLIGSIEDGGAMTPGAQTGTPTADGHAVDFQAVKAAKQMDMDAKAWNSFNQDRPGFVPMTGKQMKAQGEGAALLKNKTAQDSLVKDERDTQEHGLKQRIGEQGIKLSKSSEAQNYADATKKKADALATPTTKDLKLTEKQSSTLGAAGMAKTMLDDLATQFKGSKLGGVKGFVADVGESVPLVGGKAFPKTNAYNDKRRITAETFLREATGAAAPAAEIKFYTNLLPEPGDSEEQAQSSLNAFRGAVLAKVQGVAATLRAQGKDDQAEEIETRMKTLFDSSVNIKEADSSGTSGTWDAPSDAGAQARREKWKY